MREHSDRGTLEWARFYATLSDWMHAIEVNPCAAKTLDKEDRVELECFLKSA
jgi:hypothetical protein